MLCIGSNRWFVVVVVVVGNHILWTHAQRPNNNGHIQIQAVMPTPTKSTFVRNAFAPHWLRCMAFQWLHVNVVICACIRWKNRDATARRDLPHNDCVCVCFFFVFKFFRAWNCALCIRALDADFSVIFAQKKCFFCVSISCSWFRLFVSNCHVDAYSHWTYTILVVVGNFSDEKVENGQEECTKKMHLMNDNNECALHSCSDALMQESVELLDDGRSS